VVPGRRRFTHSQFGETERTGLVGTSTFDRVSAQVRMLLVPAVVVAHPLRVTHDCGVVTRDLQMLGEGVGPFRRRHHASSPLAVKCDEQQGGLGYCSLRLDEGLDPASSSRKLREVRRDGVVDSATLRGVPAAFLDPARRPPEPTHAPIMAASFQNRGS
jgi:hypothetical protein